MYRKHRKVLSVYSLQKLYFKIFLLRRLKFSSVTQFKSYPMVKTRTLKLGNLCYKIYYFGLQ